MAIDTLARGMAANASGGGGGGVDVGITPGVGIRFDGTDPVEIINTGVAISSPLCFYSKPGSRLISPIHLTTPSK